MKPHRFKTRLTTKEEVTDEFFAELNARKILVGNKFIAPNSGILVRANWYSSEEGVKAMAEVKLDLIKEWERKGRNMAFLKDNFDFNFMNLITQKHSGKPLQ